MKPASTITRQMIPVIERLEPRTMWSAGPAHPGTPATATATKQFAVSDIFGAAAGVAIWQGGQPALPASVGSTNPGAFPSASEGSPVTGAENGALLASATVSGSPSIFSLLPILPPDELAAEIVGMIDPSPGVTAAIFNNTTGTIGGAGSRARS
jgi:hypothetical protein